jgi:hypothetical protein
MVATAAPASVSALSADRSPSRNDEPEHGKHCGQHDSEVLDRRDLCRFGENKRDDRVDSERKGDPPQQPEGNGAPSVVVAPMVMLGIAKLEVSIIGRLAHAVTETTGGAIIMSGLRPGAVAADGTVAALKSGAATVLVVSRGTVVPTKELVSVGSAVLVREAVSEAAREAASVMVAVGLQRLTVVEMPNGVVIGSGATRGGGLKDVKGTIEGDGEDIKANGEVIGSGATTGGELTEGKGPTEGDDTEGDDTEDDDEDIKSPLVDAAPAAVAVAVAVAEPMIPVVGHTVIAPSDVPGNGLNMPR